MWGSGMIVSIWERDQGEGTSLTNRQHKVDTRLQFYILLTCEQLAILLMGSPTLGHQATSRTQSVCASSFSSNTQLSLSSLKGGGERSIQCVWSTKESFNHEVYLHILTRLSPPPVTSLLVELGPGTREPLWRNKRQRGSELHWLLKTI